MKKKMRIHRLSSELANQIAAGEVIERPASVLKELLENSIDAGSTFIEILIERSGFRSIQVQDNGSGIYKEDLTLALAQHATSKIFSLKDLEKVGSLGFRGEALASISAVSRFSLTSYVESEERGWAIKREGRDSPITLIPAPNLPGTQVVVRDLFYNTPVRRKFLRSERTEMMHLEETFKGIALSQPHIGFVLKHENKVLKRLPICENFDAESNRVAALCGHSFIKNSSYISAENNGLSLRGWISSLEGLRAQADQQYFYVNGRIVRDKVVNHAIRQAYQTLGEEKRYPAFLLFFEIDQEVVDVNVHPTKHEVRFRDSRSVHAFLSFTISEALKEISATDPKVIAKQMKPILCEALLGEELKQTEKLIYDKAVDSSEIKTSEAKWLPHKRYDRVVIAKEAPSLERKEKETEPYGTIKAVLAGELLLTEHNENLYFFDLKTLCQLHIKRTLMRAYAEGNVVQQLVLFPKSIVVHQAMELLDERKIGVDWAALGFEFQLLSPTLISLRKIPKLCKALADNYEDLITELLKSSTVSEAIDFIADPLTAGSLSLFDAEKNMRLFMEEGLLQGNLGQLQHCRTLTALELRKILF